MKSIEEGSTISNQPQFDYDRLEEEINSMYRFDNAVIDMTDKERTCPAPHNRFRKESLNAIRRVVYVIGEYEAGNTTANQIQNDYFLANKSLDDWHQRAQDDKQRETIDQVISNMRSLLHEYHSQKESAIQRPYNDFLVVTSDIDSERQLLVHTLYTAQ